MSHGEAAFYCLCMVVAAGTWGIWFRQAILAAPSCSRFGHRWPLVLVPMICAGTLHAVLATHASGDVMADEGYMYFYMFFGAAWVGLGAWLLPSLGLSSRDDVIERANVGVSHAIGGALLGLTFCFAGANVGEGPGWQVVLFCACLATWAFGLFWFFLDQATGLADTLTIDRDRAAGLRTAGLFVAAGLILGRAVAGDWESAEATLAGFFGTGWPVLVLWLVALGLERRLRPTPQRPELPLFTHGALPAFLYLGIAALSLAWAGWWQ